MSNAGRIEYAIQYTPERYYVEPMQTNVNGQTTVYWSIVSGTTRRPIGFSFDENMAKTMCLALELIRAQVYGEKSKVTQLMKLIDKLSGNAGEIFKGN